jgi:hypothetical protein
VLLTTAVRAQTPGSVSPQVIDDRQLGPGVTGAPYVADSVLTVTLSSFGEPVEQRVMARVYRDSAGRVRREQTVTGQERPGSPDQDLVVTILDPVAGVLIALNPASRTAHRMPLGGPPSTAAQAPQRSAAQAPQRSAAQAPQRSAAQAPQPTVADVLGTEVIEGLVVNGHRTVTTLPPGTDGRVVEISDERWESSDLRIAVIERHRDSRTGVFEHRLTNIKRTEPDRQLFTIPAAYTIVDVTVPATR